jgi:hypothetical protein
VLVNIDKVGWPKCGRLIFLEYVGREPDIIFTLHTQDSHGNTINNARIEDIEEEGIISMLWIGSKDKIDFLLIII